MHAVTKAQGLMISDLAPQCGRLGPHDVSVCCLESALLGSDPLPRFLDCTSVHLPLGPGSVFLGV